MVFKQNEVWWNVVRTKWTNLSYPGKLGENIDVKCNNNREEKQTEMYLGY